MINYLYKLASLFEKLATSKTLYHGTSIDNVKSIKQKGLIPPVGPWVERAYGHSMDLDPDSEDYGGSYESPVFDLVFAADKQELSKALGGITSSVAHKLGKNFHDVTDDEIEHYGALVVMRDSAKYFERSAPIDRQGDTIGEGTLDQDQLERYPTVEPGDYFSEQIQDPSYILTGKPMIRLFRRYGIWPRLWGPDRRRIEKNKREQLIKILQKMKIETYDENDNITVIDTPQKAADYVDAYGADELYKELKENLSDNRFKAMFEG
jgi:hypothetical protein